LLERLDPGLNCKLTVISAPAGYGKTTLLSAWIQGCDRPIAWLSLDEGDNYLPLFFSYLITALQKINHQFGQGLLGKLKSTSRVEIDVASELLMKLPGGDTFLLILDDYQPFQMLLFMKGWNSSWAPATPDAW
jgi:LuxR family maltose regulon positive regulatory protein